MWWDKLIQPQGDPWLLRWDLAKTNFLDRDLPPAFLYYTPEPGQKRITIEHEQGKGQIYDLTLKRALPSHGARVELSLGAHEARVIEMRSSPRRAS